MVVLMAGSASPVPGLATGSRTPPRSDSRGSRGSGRTTPKWLRVMYPRGLTSGTTSVVLHHATDFPSRSNIVTLVCLNRPEGTHWGESGHDPQGGRRPAPSRPGERERGHQMTQGRLG